MMRWFAILPFLALWMLCGCKKTTDDYKAKGLEYFPIRVGAERHYEYDSIHYSRIQNKAQVFHFLIKEFVKDSFIDQAGNNAYRLEQFVSKDTGKSYQFFDLVTVSINGFGVQRVEENRRNQVLSFPIRNLKMWYPYSYWNDSFNSYIKFQYTAVGKPFSNGFVQSADAVYIKQQYDSTFIYVKEAREIYGNAFGLMYRKKKDIDFQDPSKPDGFDLTWQLTKYYP